MSQLAKKPSVWGGTMIVAGTTVGAGMLALPTTSAGMWSLWSMILMGITWLCLFLTSKALLEVNLHFEPGANFNSLVKSTLGPVWNVINGFSLGFVLYLLLYAYTSGGSSTVHNFLQSSMGIEGNKIVIGILFLLVLALVVWISTAAVDRVATIMMISLIVSFIASLSGMGLNLSMENLLDTNGAQDGRFIFLWAAVSTYLTSFAFHCSVPSLVKYFGKEPKIIEKCLIYGTGFALVCYIIWIILTQGTISREEFKMVIAEGGNVGTLVNAASGSLSNIFVTRALDMFAFMALTTSFLGVGLGLFDYIADLLNIDDSPKGRTLTAFITFTPPMIGGVFFPNGFISAIAWAGFFCAIWAVIIPSLMLIKVRKEKGAGIYTAYKNTALSYVLIAYGVIAGVCHILSVLNLLPLYK